MRSLKYMVLSAVIIYLLLLIPDRNPAPFHAAPSNPFAWNMDDHWQELETIFQQARSLDSERLDSLLKQSSAEANYVLASVQRDSVVSYDDARYEDLLKHFFVMASLHAAARESDWIVSYYNAVRDQVKKHSHHWDLNDEAQRATLYRLLYGLRAGMEEVLLQADTINFNPVQLVTNEPSSTPSAILQGIRVHSGDLLVSRGGAEVSAFISRGNDYPGNFSHVALLYVDADTRKPYFIEAHIEKGVAIATAEEYLKDKKLRFMVLRPRADLPALQQHPELPHAAAALALQEANQRHIPYDFKMNFHDTTAMFCSEVGSYAYGKKGIQLWQSTSTISAQGTVNWLNAFGVENFITQMPSDLEYDPQLSIVAEWCDPQTLMKDHIDNAVMDALLERANEGLEIGYNHWLLPLARIVKGFSLIQNALGKPGIIPEGMSATRGLKNNDFVALYNTVRKKTEAEIENFIRENGYRPPYWQLVAIANRASKE
ncbi:MAG: hypothetical protein MUE95_08725 [Cyclobacteriaceae bacterium]|nr:hypothetical protein [Cyclobacteriaceae bacterium]